MQLHEPGLGVHRPAMEWPSPCAKAPAPLAMSGRVLTHAQGRSGTLMCIAFSKDGDRLYCGGDDRSVHNRGLAFPIVDDVLN
jgi:hypothetical protein